MQRMYRTPKGTELPLLNLRGREYLEVKYRIVWFREDHPDWAIETELLSVTDNSAYARALIKDEHGRTIATSHKFETQKGFPDFIEKAETGAIGRALALIGYGTQFCADELDDGRGGNDFGSAKGKSSAKRPEAAPTAAPRTPSAAPASAPKAAPASAKAAPTAPPAEAAAARPKTQTPGDYTITFGNRYNGQKLRDIPKSEVEGYLAWLEKSAKQKGVPLSEDVRAFKTAATKLFQN